MPLVSGRVLGCWTYDQQLAVSDPGCCSVKSNPGQVVLHRRASVTKQCNLVPAQAGKVWRHTGHASQTQLFIHLHA